MNVEHVCETCGQTFTRSGHLTQHIRIHTGERPYKCDHPGCQNRYSRKDHLRRHELSHHPELKHLECPHDNCNMRFDTRQKLDRHVASHNRPKLFQCPDCSEKFVKKYQLAAHSTLHTGKKPYPCTVDGCSMSFLRSNTLKRHVQNCHLSQKVYICSDQRCTDTDASFTKFTDLQKHIKKMHPKVRKTACDYCGAVFLKSNDLKNHKRTHEVPVADRLEFVCKYPGCNAAYTKSSNLGTHIRSKHEDTSAFICSVCETAFSLKSSLKRHMKKLHNIDLLPSSRSKRLTVSKDANSTAYDDEAAAAAAAAFQLIDDDPMLSPKTTPMQVNEEVQPQSNNPASQIDETPSAQLSNTTALCVLPAVTSLSVPPAPENANRIVCTQCNGTFARNESLQIHIQKHHKKHASPTEAENNNKCMSDSAAAHNPQSSNGTVNSLSLCPQTGRAPKTGRNLSRDGTSSQASVSSFDSASIVPQAKICPV